MNQSAWWHKYVPNYANNPVRLAWELLKDRNPAARSAMYMALAGVITSPLDLYLSRKEQEAYTSATDDRYPIILVCGPPRSGTTLVAQYLINNLDVCYLNNLTSIFPRSPVYANRVFGRFVRLKPGDFSAFYGKSRGLSGANDALYIWDRWLGADRESVPDSLVDETGEGMRRFFSALGALYQKPIVNKVNRLNTCAHLVANELPEARFICVRREPLHLAQSLYVARGKIMGSYESPYGVQHAPTSTDAVEDVCLQVVFHERHIRQQRAILGDDRFVVLSYEEFCQRPAELIDFVIDRFDGLSRRGSGEASPREFVASRSPKVPEDILQKMQQCLEKFGAEDINDSIAFPGQRGHYENR